MRLRKERSISIVYDAVSISKDIEVIGGPLTLNFYVESGSFVPNRFLTPLVLKPIIYVVDPNNLLPEGDKSDELVKCNWYENGEKIISGDDYKINKDNSLTVLKNSTRDLTISFSATWLDPRKKQEITIEESVDLVCVQLAGDTSNPVLKLDKPLNWIHNPLKNDRIYTIKAYISKDKIYEGAVEWYYSTKGKEPKLIDNTLLAYEGGQYTNELKLNSAYLENCLITAKNLSNDKLKEYYWFFDENGNPLTYDEPQYKDIEGSNYFEFPEEALATRAKVRFEGLTLTNLVKNGDFGAGLNGWKRYDNPNTMSASYSRLIFNGVPTNNAGYYTNDIEVHSEDVVYVCFLSSFDFDEENGIYVHLWYNSDLNSTIKSIRYLRGFNSEVVKLSDEIENIGIYIRQAYNAKGFDGQYMTGFKLINLTETFGAGNEPTKEWCDEHIQGYFEGTKSVTAPLRIKSVGENLCRIMVDGTILGKKVQRNFYKVSDTEFGFNQGSWTLSFFIPGTYETNISIEQLRRHPKLPKNKPLYIQYDSEHKRGGIDVFLYGEDGESKKLSDYGVIKDSMELIYIPPQTEDLRLSLNRIFDSAQDTMRELYIGFSKPSRYVPYKETVAYINNQLGLRSVGEVKDYIENGKLYKKFTTSGILNKENIGNRDPHSAFKKCYSFEIIYDNSKAKYQKAGGYCVFNDGEFLKNLDAVTLDVEGVYISSQFKPKMIISKDKIDSQKGETIKDKFKNYIGNRTFEITYELEETEVINLTTTGKVLSHPNGSVFIDYVTKTSSYYIKDKGFKFEGDSSKIVSLRSGSGNNYYDVSKIKKAGDNLYTHPDIKEDTILTIEYETGPSIYGNNTISYMSIKEVLDELWLEDVYTYKGVEDSEGNITWEFVRLVDIDNYEEWLTQDKISPYTLAPDGIIFGKYKADTKFLRQFPSSLYVDIIIPNRLKDGSGKVKARALVGTADGIIENPERYFKITWLRRDIKAGSKDEVIGYGEEILLDIDEKSSISIDVEDLGVFKALTDEKGKYLTDENNTILVGR